MARRADGKSGRVSILSRGIRSGFPCEFLSAFGAADADLSPAAGHANRLLAVRAVEIAVMAVLQPHPELGKLFVLPLALVNIARKHPEKAVRHQAANTQG